MTCTHVETMDLGKEPDTLEGCGDCLREGTQWVHLRECLGCGHVACCDNSPRRHATAHFRATEHPVIKSFEPGEAWVWCYVDKQMYEYDA